MMLTKKPESSLQNFSEWLEKKRKEKQWSLENLACELEKQGYPISKNKLWRIEHISESNLKKIDLELKIRLESVFKQSFSQQATSITNEELVVSIIELINKWKKSPSSVSPPDDPLLRKVYLHLIK